jgi:predicted GNAT family acetyltransferase
LQANGFVEEARLHLMICTPESVVSATGVSDLAITDLQPEPTVEDLHDYSLTVAQGFNPERTDPPTEQEIEQARQNLRTVRSFLGRIGHEPAGAASYTQPLDGVTEIVGIATREPFRRRGRAGALTAHAVLAAFAEGATLACLTAGDSRAGRVYERVGFQPYATMLFYLDPANPE